MDVGMAGRVVVITGASGAIGSAIARALAGEDAHVVAGYHRNERSAQDLAHSAAFLSGHIEPVRLDVTDDESVEHVMADVANRHGKLDGLVNCAGVASFSTLTEHTLVDWDRIIAVNLRGPFSCIRAAVPYLARQGGDIVNISSLAARTGSFEGPAYSSSKAGLNAMTHSLAMELAASDIRVNAVAPGRIDTPFRRQKSGEYFDFMLAQTPLHRMGSCDEIAALTVFLLSRACGFMTGETVYASGGLQSVWLHPVTPDPDSPLQSQTSPCPSPKGPDQRGHGQ